MTNHRTYDWKRFWCPRNGSIDLIGGGYLADPDSRHGSYLNPSLLPFQDISHIPCLALLGEPGIGKTETMQAERRTVEAAILARGGKTLWLDLRSCGSESRLVSKLFESREFTQWMNGDYRLHLFLDSLDECLLRVDTVAALLSDELQGCSVERLSLRIGCRTAEWPTNLLESALKKLWGEESFRAYELAPLRQTDVASAATTNGIAPDAFLKDVQEAEAVPLAIKPVTLSFLMDSYLATGEFPARQADLYLEGCRWLCEERNDSRVASGRTGELTADQRLAVAARIAAVTVFSNKYAVWNGIQQATLEREDVLVRTLASGTEFVEEDEFAVGEDAIRETLRTGLFSGRGPEKLGWAHQTYAEFLAARYLVQRDVAMEKAMSLLVHPEDEDGRLVPQLHEAAAWTASMSPEMFRRLAEADPEVLLRSDVASVDAEGKAALIGTMLRLYDEERLLDVGWAPRDRYKRLEYSGLAEQLRPYVVDNSKSLSARRVAIDIAEACGLLALQDETVEIALDTDEDLLIRKEAAHFIAVAGKGSTRARLLPLASGVADDPDDDLKGNGLRAVWPEHVSADELFGLLALPKNPNYMGSYGSFLTYDLADHLRTADLPAALAWVESLDPDRGQSFRFGELADRIMQRAWAELLNPGIVPAFAGAALARLRCYEEVIKERKEVFEAIGEQTFSERVAADDHRRRLLLEEMIGLLMLEKEDVHYLIHWKTPLVIREDVAWFVEKLRTEASEQRKAVLAALVGQTYRMWGEAEYGIVYLAHLEDPSLAHEVGRIFAPVELGSEEAEAQRRSHERISRWEKEDEEPPPPDPPVLVRVVSALDNFEAGNFDSFWADVYYFMQYDERGHGNVSEVEWDITTLPGWETADNRTRARIIEAAKRWVLEGDPQTDEWLGKAIIYRPAFAGYRALCLILRFAPEFLQGLTTDVWEKWIPIILDFPVTLNTEEENGPHLRLVAMAYDRAPDRLISVLTTLIGHEDATGAVFITRRLELCWDDRLAQAVLDKAKDLALKPTTFGVLLGELLNYGLQEARDFVEALVAPGSENDEEHMRRAAVAARALFYGAEDSGWNVLWPAMQEDDRFGSAVVDEVSSGVRHADLPYEHLSEREVADFYVWMVRRYPISEYFINWGDGMITYGRKENISEWRDGAIKHLRDRGTFEACRQIERIAVKLPELQNYLKWTLYQARAEARRRTWVATEPLHVLELITKRSTWLVQNGDQLLDVVTESLWRLEAKLQGEIPAAPDLWNEREDGTYRPKDEEAFSDYVKRYLQEDLEGRGVVVNREVVIRRGEGSGQGERTDLHVDAVTQNPHAEGHDIVTVIIEVKGCWYFQLYKAMEIQLANRYLRNNRCRHGLYLVGWFNCLQWDPEDSRQKVAMRRELDTVQKKLNARASALSEGDLYVRPLTLNTALR